MVDGKRKAFGGIIGKIGRLSGIIAGIKLFYISSIDRTRVVRLTSTLSDVFQVYSPKLFPGMAGKQKGTEKGRVIIVSVIL